MRFPSLRPQPSAALFASVLLGCSLVLSSACGGDDAPTAEDSADSVAQSGSSAPAVPSSVGTEPGGTEPGGTEPGGTEPGGTEPGGTEPGGTEPGGTEPGGTEPGGTEPGDTEPGDTEPGGTEPGGTEPGGTEPGGTEPGGTEPGGTEPGGSEPGGTEPDGCRDNSDCGEREFCLFGAEDPCGEDGSRGTCTPTPDGCGGVVQPVCGCDGRDYSNGCVAAIGGTSVRHQGTCDAGPCGTLPAFGCCFDDDACSAETRCVGAICQREREEAGTCVTRDLDPGECWDDGDCTSDTRCHGAERCPCAHACLLPDEPGTCEPFIGLPPDPVE